MHPTPQTPSQERRSSVRYRASANRARIEWLEDDELHSAQGSLVDISHGGAQLRVERDLGTVRSLWLRLEEPMNTDEIPATIVRIGHDQNLGLAFARPCPHDLHLTATLGVNPYHARVGNGLER